MFVQRITVGFTKNMGNFQSNRVEVSIELSPDDDPDVALLAASGIVHEALGMEVDQTESTAMGLLENRRFEVAEGK